MKRKLKKREFVLLAVLAFILIVLLAIGGVEIYQRYFGMILINSGEYAPVTDAGEYNIVYSGEYNRKAIMVDNQLYLDMDVVNEEWAGGLLFYADDVGKVMYTTATERTESEINRDDFKMWQDTVYMRADLAKEMFGLPYKINEEQRMVAINSPDAQMAEVIVSSAYLLNTPDPEERMFTVRLHAEDVVSVYETDAEDYYYVMSEDGYTGYLEKDEVKLRENKLSRKQPKAFKLDSDLLPQGRISLAWQQLYSNEFNQYVWGEIEDTSYYVNIVSPTWFHLNADGSVSSLANKEYVDWVHYRGLQVWALIDNGFDDALTYEVLSSTELRQNLVIQLLQFCKEYDLNGINVDFEQMGEETVHYFIQFLRELSIALRTNGYILSVDCPVPSEWTDYYRRDVMAEVCDYVIVMAYDEHYGGGPEAGSTASQNFTFQAVFDMLAEGVSKEKLILGIPFYTRIWMEGDELTSEAVSMWTVDKCIEEKGLTKSYDRAVGQYYAEGWVEDTLYRIWIEDASSMSWRLKLMKDNKLAGTAAWSLGLQNAAIWKAFEEAFYK